jgi:hypothetical protein
MYNQAQNNILNFLSSRNYTLISSINDVKTNSDNFEYICSCGINRKRCLYDIINNGNEIEDKNYTPKCCIKDIHSNDLRYKWYLDDNINEYKEGTEHWKRFQQYWVSNKGKVIGKKGNNLIENGYIKTSKRTYSLIELMATVFKAIEFTENKIPYFEDCIIHSDNLKFKDNYLSYINSIDTKDLEETPCKVLDEFPDYKIYKNGVIVRTPSGKVKNEKIPTHEKYNNKLCIKFKDSNRYCVNILTLMAFNPFFEEKENYKTYLNDLVITHIDGDYSNCNIDNIIAKYKDPSKEKQRKIREQARINDLHTYLNSFLLKIEGELKSNINDIKSINIEFEYKCKCDTLFKRTIKHLKDNEESNQCFICRSKLIHKDNSTNEVIEINNILYKSFEYGWISENGDFINNNKEKINIRRDGMVKISGKFQNAKHVIAKVYEIPHFEYLSKEGYIVKTKDNSNNISPNNLYVWGNGLKETIHLPLSKPFDDVVKLLDKKSSSCYYFVLLLPPEFEYRTSSEFPSIMVYKNGLIKVSENTYTIGRIKESGYSVLYTSGKTHLFHRIVCFLFNPIEGKTKFKDYKELDVNHKNGDKMYNHADNLEWVTKSENMRHAIDTGLTGYTYPVNQYELSKDGSKGKLIKTYPCIKYAIKETGQSRDYIMSICKGETKPYKYIWEFVNKEHIEKSQTKKRIKLVADSQIIIDDEDIIPVQK